MPRARALPSQPRRALLPDVGVLALVPDEWNLTWQPRQQVLVRLARYFHVVWVNPPRHWRWWARETGRTVPAPEPVEDAARFVVYKALLPRFYRPPRLARLMQAVRLSRARAILVRRRCTKILLYLWRPEFADALDLVPFTQSHYHIDDEYSFRQHETPLSDKERLLIGAVDQVFVTSRGLLAGKGGSTVTRPSSPMASTLGPTRRRGPNRRNLPRSRGPASATRG